LLAFFAKQAYIDNRTLFPVFADITKAFPGYSTNTLIFFCVFAKNVYILSDFRPCLAFLPKTLRIFWRFPQICLKKFALVAENAAKCCGLSSHLLRWF